MSVTEENSESNSLGFFFSSTLVLQLVHSWFQVFCEAVSLVGSPQGELTHHHLCSGSEIPCKGEDLHPVWDTQPWKELRVVNNKWTSSRGLESQQLSYVSFALSYCSSNEFQWLMMYQHLLLQYEVKQVRVNHLQWLMLCLRRLKTAVCLSSTLLFLVRPSP